MNGRKDVFWCALISLLLSLSVWPAERLRADDCNHNGISDNQDIANGTSRDCNTNGIPDECDLTGWWPAYDDPANWATYNPGASGAGTDPVGYIGCVFDGQYVHFAPYHNQDGHHGEVLRYDTARSFASISSWAAYDAGVHGVGTKPVGYYGTVFDGRYVYFAPYTNETGNPHGEVLRYDTAGNFASVSSWAAYDPSANGVGQDPTGYTGGVFDGRYIYFVPYASHSPDHNEVLRYDTVGDFADASSWSTYDPRANGIGNEDPDRYTGAAFDGRYIYFAPYQNDDERCGEVLRYDTTSEFGHTSSWTVYDPAANGAANDSDGYQGAVFDGRYVYFVPWFNGVELHGEVLRYDTQGAFSQAASWAAYDPGAHGVGDDPDGYFGAVFDGRYLYFVPENNGTERHGEVLFYDTLGEFTNASSWAAYDPGAHGIGHDPDGYRGAAFDGRYVYFTPYYNGTELHGEVLRYDVTDGGNRIASDCNANGILDECELAGNDCNNNSIPDDCEPGLGAPLITTQPADQAVCEGEPVTFTVVARGSRPISYQWRHDAADIPDATGASYTISATTPDAGEYDVIVTNDCQAVTSRQATLTVFANPQVIITATPGDHACGDTKITLEAGADYATYLWSPDGQITQTILVWTSGTYAVAATTADGCESTDTITVTVRHPGDLGDFDNDCDVDLEDYAHLYDCLTGPNGGRELECENADLNSDFNVDLKDHAVFQWLFTGPW